MKSVTKMWVVLVVVGAMLLATLGIAPMAAQANADDSACWGQATAVFAKLGKMGEHASDPTEEDDNPRVGLRNLARSLYEQGVLPDDTLQSLGAFVAAAFGLSIDACL